MKVKCILSQVAKFVVIHYAAQKITYQQAKKHNLWYIVILLKFCFCGVNYTSLFHWHHVVCIPIPAERMHSCPLNLRSDNLIFFGLQNVVGRRNFESQLEVGYVSFSFLYLCLTYVENMKVLVAQLHLTFCNSMDWFLHGIFQARILEWVAIPFSRYS